MSAPYDVCVVEDDDRQRALITRFITEGGFACVDAVDGPAGWDVIHTVRPKVILCDWHLPGCDGLELLHRVRCDPELAATYFILATGDHTSENKTHALRHEVDDYMSKPLDPREVLARVRVGIRLWTMQQRLLHAATTDGLTGLYNHEHLTHVLTDELNRSRRYGRPLSLIMLDLDFFKAVNDTFGHVRGNETLQRIAEVLRKCVRDVDKVGRFGGDEFAVVAPESTFDDAVAVAQRIRIAICETLHIKELAGHPLSVSIGVANTDDVRVHNADDLVELADHALYLAKRRGRNQVATTLETLEETEAQALIDNEEIQALRRRVAVLSIKAKEVYMQSIAALVQALEEKDGYSAQHSLNVAYYAERIARHMGCSESLVQSIRYAGLLHDIGKIGIPDRILMKAASLTSLEQAVMNQVPNISSRIVDHLTVLESEIQIIRHQREYFDGSGFPNALRGEQIPIGSRILLVADAFDAMTTDRLYRPSIAMDEAQTELKRCAGQQFDPRVVVAVRQLAGAHRRAWQRRIDETIESLRNAMVGSKT